MKQKNYELIGGDIVHRIDPVRNEFNHPGLDAEGESCIGDAHYFQHAADGKISCYYCGLSRYVEQDNSDEH